MDDKDYGIIDVFNAIGFFEGGATIYNEDTDEDEFIQEAYNSAKSEIEFTLSFNAIKEFVQKNNENYFIFKNNYVPLFVRNGYWGGYLVINDDGSISLCKIDNPNAVYNDLVNSPISFRVEMEIEGERTIRCSIKCGDIVIDEVDCDNDIYGNFHLYYSIEDLIRTIKSIQKTGVIIEYKEKPIGFMWVGFNTSECARENWVYRMLGMKYESFVSEYSYDDYKKLYIKYDHKEDEVLLIKDGKIIASDSCWDENSLGIVAHNLLSQHYAKEVIGSLNENETIHLVRNKLTREILKAYIINVETGSVKKIPDEVLCKLHFRAIENLLNYFLYTKYEYSQASTVLLDDCGKVHLNGKEFKITAKIDNNNSLIDVVESHQQDFFVELRKEEDREDFEFGYKE